MPMTDTEIAEYAATEARRQELVIQASAQLAQISSLGLAQNAIQKLLGDLQTAYAASKADLDAFMAGKPVGLWQMYGSYSILEKAMRIERFAGKGAVVDYIKANPTCTQEEAVGVYETAAMAARPPERQYFLQNSLGLLQEYQSNAFQMGFIPENTWAGFRGLIIATPKETIMAM